MQSPQPAHSPQEHASVTALGYQLHVHRVEDRVVQQIMQHTGRGYALSYILASKQIPMEEIENYLHPTLKASLPDPTHLLDMKKAAERLAEAITAKQKIVVFGDYDVDGATASALLVRFVRMAGHEAQFYIPDRIAEGYGPNKEAFLKLREQGNEVLITVDCGAVAFEPIAAARAAGLDVLVMDHHLGAETLPEAHAIVNPNRHDETTTHRYFAAVGVSFLLAVATNTLLRERGWYANRTAPDLMQLLDLVALGTVCDVMPLIGANRALVAQGLKILGNRKNLGLKTLADIAGLDSPPSVYHLGFVLGPRINAGGRIGTSSLGARLLTTEDPVEAEECARQLHALNDERRAMEAQMVEEAIADVERDMMDLPFLMLVKHGWHQGVVGVVASRLKDRFEKPVLMVTVERGVGKASCRSIHGVDLGTIISNAREAGILLTGGGHAMAAGFTVAEAKIPEFRNYLTQIIGNQVQLLHAARTREVDVVLPVSAMTSSFVDELEALEPFGTGNQAPVIMLKHAKIAEVRPMHEKHLICMLAQDTLSGTKGSYLRATAYHAATGPLADALYAAQGKHVDVIGTVGTHYYRGTKKLHFTIYDAVV